MMRRLLILSMALTSATTGCDSDKAAAATEAVPTTADAAPAATASPRMVHVTVDDKGFHPNHVEAVKGQKLTLEFERTHDGTCATKVVFPEVNIEKDLPLNEKVPVDVPTGKARTLAFQCGMGMYKSAVLVK